MKKIVLLFTIIGIAIVTSCNNDDDDIGEVIPPRLLSDVEAENDSTIVAFLRNNTYNYEEFQNAEAGFDFKIRFSPLEGDNAEKDAIFDRTELITEIISVKSTDFGRDDGEEIAHKLYILVARQGVVNDSMPTIGDNSVLRYEGSLVDGTFFDASSNQPVVFNLSGLVRGFGNGMEYLQKGNGPIDNDDGTISYTEYGVGAFFIPSGLGYFASPPSGSIPAYESLIFTVDAFDYEPNTDTDGDGIPNFLEDVDGDGNLNFDDTDEDNAPNYIDADDDNDGTPTLEEISDANGDISIPYPDSDNDGTPDYLDSDS